MAQFTEGQSVTVRPDSRAVYVTRDDSGRPVREHLACSMGTIAAGERQGQASYRVAFDFGEWGSFIATLDARDLEA